MAEATGRYGWASILLVWAIALVGAIVVVTLQLAAPGTLQVGSHAVGPFGALVVVLAITVLAGLVVQLATRRPPGFVARLAASLAGAVGVLLLAAVALIPSVLAA